MRIGVPRDSVLACFAPGRDCCTLSIRYRALRLCQRHRTGAGQSFARARATPMWQNLSLRGRINLLLALLLALGLAVNIGRQVTEAGPRVQAEDQSVIRLAREFIEMIVADLNEAPDPDARLNQIARDLSRLRHVSIALQDAGGNPLTQPRTDADDDTR